MTGKPHPPQPPGNAPGRRISGVKLIGFGVVTMALGLICGLALAEAMLRALAITPQRFDRPAYLALVGERYINFGNLWGSDGKQFFIKQPSSFQQAGVLMGEYVPGAQFKIVYASNPRGYFNVDNSVSASINAMGMRGRQLTVRKPPQTFRILGLGDSFTFGVGVRDGDTFLSKLEASLNSDLKRELNYEVLNAGVQGYNTRDEVIYLENRWMQLDPDVVLIVFYINDAYNDSAILNNGEAQGVQIEKPAGLAQVSHLYDYLQHMLRARQASKKVEEFYLQQYFQSPKTYLDATKPGDVQNVDWHVSKAALQHAKQLTDARGIKLALVMFPELYELNDEYPFKRVHELVMNTCGELGIPSLDLFDTFKGHDERKLWAHPSDHHPNEVAHDMAARAIEQFLLQHVLPQPATEGVGR